MHRASLKLVKAAPAVCAFQSLIREASKNGAAADREYCIIDMGYSSIRMHMFKGDRHIVTRALETGMRNIDGILAEVYSVDPHTAHNYLLSNFENCQNKEQCLSAFGNMAVELMRAMNFYRFSNRDSQLSDVWLTGGGAVIEPLRQAIVDALDMTVHDASELVAGGELTADCHTYLLAIGATMV